MEHSLTNKTPPKRVGEPFKRATLADAYDVIIIGAGASGLSTAAVLAKYAGRKVLVLEQHYTAGGCTHVFHRGHHEWDVGLHYVGGKVGIAGSPFNNWFGCLTDGKLDWIPYPQVTEKFHIGGRTYSFPRGEKAWLEQMGTYFPNEKRALREYVRMSREAGRSFYLWVAEKMVPTPIKWVAGGMLRRPLLRYASQTSAQVLAQLTTNEELRGVLGAQWLDFGVPPTESVFLMHGGVFDHYLDGAWYPRGGSGEIGAKMVATIERCGGRVVVAAGVQELVVQQGRVAGVRMENGRVFTAPLVVSSAGAVNTFTHLLPKDVSPPADLTEFLAHAPYTMSHVSAYLGLKGRTIDAFADVGNIWDYPTADYSKTIREIGQSGAPLGVFMSSSSSRDPTYAERYGDRSAMQILTAIDYQDVAQWSTEGRWMHRGDAYEAYKADIGERMLQIAERWVPDVRQRLETLEVSTPLSMQHFTGWPKGTLYGLAITHERFKVRFLEPRTWLPGLYITGQDVMANGVMGAVISGLATASAITGSNYILGLSRPKMMRSA